MYRDRGYYWLRLVIYIALAAGLGTLYYDLGYTYASIQVRHQTSDIRTWTAFNYLRYVDKMLSGESCPHMKYIRTLFQARGSLLAFVASFLTFMAIGGFPSFVEDMKVFTIFFSPNLYVICMHKLQK